MDVHPANNFVSMPHFDDYRERFKEHYRLQRRDDGVVLVEAHTRGGSIQLSVQNHRSLGQLFKTIGAALLTGQAIDAKKALEYGLVNEVVPRERLLERAYALADHIMTQPRITRRLTTQSVRRPWRKRISDDLDGGFGIQMFAHLAKEKAINSRDHIAKSVAYVKAGKENNFPDPA